MKNMEFVGLPEYAISKDGRVFSSKCNRFLKDFVSTNGYRVWSTLDWYEKKSLNFYIHRLVAQAYVPNDDVINKTQVNHKNGDKLDCRAENLIWSTPSENTQHANDTGLRKKPFKEEDTPDVPVDLILHDWKKAGKPPSIWTEDEARNASQLLEQGFRVCDVSSMSGLCRRSLQALRDGQGKWGHLALEYDFSKLRKKEQHSVEKIVDICKLLSLGETINSTAEKTGIERKVVAGIKSRKTHTQVSADFKF